MVATPRFFGLVARKPICEKLESFFASQRSNAAEHGPHVFDEDDDLVSWTCAMNWLDLMDDVDALTAAGFVYGTDFITTSEFGTERTPTWLREDDGRYFHFVPIGVSARVMSDKGEASLRHAYDFVMKCLFGRHGRSPSSEQYAKWLEQGLKDRADVLERMRMRRDS